MTVNELSYVELFAFSVREAIRKFFGREVIVGAAQRREIIFDDFASRFRGSIFPGFLVSGRFTVFRSTSIRFSSRNMPGASASCQLLRRWITIFKYSTFFVRKYGDGRCQPHPRCPDIYTYIYIYIAAILDAVNRVHARRYKCCLTPRGKGGRGGGARR